MDINHLDSSWVGKMPADEIIVEHIRQLIQSKKLAHNKKLPSGKQLASTWGLSYVTVQKGLARCAQEGLLLRSPGRGTVVNAQSRSQNKNNEFTRQIYVVIQQKKHEKNLDFLQSDYFSRLLAGLHGELMKSGILTISATVGSKEQEEIFIRSLAKNPVDLVIVLRFNDNDFLAKIKKMSLPVVLIDPHSAPKNETVILQDEEKVARDVVNYLLSRGHRHIAPAIITNDKWVTQFRYDAAVKAIKGQYLKEFPDLAAGADFLKNPDKAKTKIIKILGSKEPPTALLINGNKFYDFITKIAEDINVKIPDELLLVQYSDNPDPLVATPKIMIESFSYGSTVGRIIYKMFYAGKENFYKPRTFYVPMTLHQ
jgi:DNA-binding LacI/PurR family transcriptional regulator